MDEKSFDDFAKRHHGLQGGITGIICVNGKQKRFFMEFPQALTYESFNDVMDDMRVQIAREMYERHIIIPR